MGRGYYYTLGFLALHLLFLLMIIQDITGIVYIAFVAVFLMFLVLSTIIITIEKNLRYPLMSVYFGCGILFLLFIYFNVRTYLILPYAIIEVAGYIYSLEQIKEVKASSQRKISDYFNANFKVNNLVVKNITDQNSGDKEKEQTKEQLTLPDTQKYVPKVEVYTEEPHIREPALFIGSKTSGKYHLPGCRYVKNISTKNKVTFSSLKDAKDKGFKKCVCVKR
ncbi:MAG: hypothetical protein V1859_00410 [archaeon]